MPTVLRRSGPSFERNGVTIEPRAMIHTCEDCGRHAPFLLYDGKTMRSWCGWDGEKPVCVRKSGKKIADLLQAGETASRALANHRAL